MTKNQCINEIKELKIAIKEGYWFISWYNSKGEINDCLRWEKKVLSLVKRLGELNELLCCIKIDEFKYRKVFFNN